MRTSNVLKKQDYMSDEFSTQEQQRYRSLIAGDVLQDGDERRSVVAENAERRLANERDALRSEADNLRAAAGFCEKHQPNGGSRNCLVCGIEALYAALHRIAQTIGKEDDFAISMDHERLAEQVIAKVEWERLKQERDALLEYQRAVQSISCIERETVKECKALMKDFQSGGEDVRDLLDMVKDWVAAEAVSPEGQYEGADGLEDVVRWLISERDEAQAQLAATTADAQKMREALEFYADPDTYVAIMFVPDRPCGDFINDIGEVETDWGLEHRPGAKARAALRPAPEQEQER